MGPVADTIFRQIELPYRPVPFDTHELVQTVCIQLLKNTPLRVFHLQLIIFMPRLGRFLVKSIILFICLNGLLRKIRKYSYGKTLYVCVFL